MAFKLNKGNINFGEGTKGFSPNKLKTKVIAKGAGKALGPAGYLLELPDIAHKMFTFSGGKGYGEFPSHLGQKPKYIDPATNKPVDLSKKNYSKNMITGKVTITDKKKNNKNEIPDWAYEAANIENPNKPKEDSSKEESNTPRRSTQVPISVEEKKKLFEHIHSLENKDKDIDKTPPPKKDPPKKDPPKKEVVEEEIIEDKKKKKKKKKKKPKFRYNF